MPRVLRFIALAAALAVPPGAAGAATLEVGAGQPYPLPSAAAAAARDGDRIHIAAGAYTDCAVWRAANLTIEGAGPAATVISGPACQGKALFVVQGDNATVRNLTLTGARVPDFNGAGIRAEGGNLTVQHVRFTDNQDGILATSRPESRILISDSEFIGNGTCEGKGGCAHGIYINNYALLRVERSRFAGTHEGHHIKSRAQRTEIVGCDLADGATGTASYAIDLPNGGAALVRGNRIEKGPRADNQGAAIMIGAEGVTRATPEIAVEGNTLTVDGGYRPALVVNRTATPARLTGNTLGGGAIALQGPGTVE